MRSRFFVVNLPLCAQIVLSGTKLGRRTNLCTTYSLTFQCVEEPNTPSFGGFVGTSAQKGGLSCHRQPKKALLQQTAAKCGRPTLNEELREVPNKTGQAKHDQSRSEFGGKKQMSPLKKQTFLITFKRKRGGSDDFEQNVGPQSLSEHSFQANFLSHFSEILEKVRDRHGVPFKKMRF